MGNLILRYMGARRCHFATQTITGLTANLSMVDALAFITNPSTDLGQYAGCKLTLIDTAGKKAIGWLGAKGAGETYTDLIGGTNPALLNGDFSLGDTVWSKSAGATIEDQGGGDYEAVLNVAATNLGVSQSHSAPANCLLYASVACTARTAGSFSVWVESSNPGTIIASFNTTGTKTGYRTYVSGTKVFTIFSYGGAAQGRFDDVTFKQVLTPSATGATILSTLGGAQSFWFKDTAFNPNSATFTAIVEG